MTINISQIVAFTDAANAITAFDKDGPSHDASHDTGGPKTLGR